MSTLRIKLLASLVAVFGLLAHLPSMATVVSVTKDKDGVTLKLDKGLMKVKICGDAIVEVKYTTLAAFADKKSLVVNNEWKNTPAFTFTESKADITLTTGKLIVKINKKTEAIQYLDLNGKLVLAEDANGKKMEAATIAGINTYNCSASFLSPADEALFGLGCHPEDSLAMNYKGRNQDLAIKYLTGAIPVLTSTKGYGLLFDNYSASNFYGGEAKNTKYKYVSESGQMLDYYFFFGPSMDKVVDGYRTATGSAQMYGKWAYGLFQSQDRYKTQAEVLSVKDNYRNNKIPVDVIVQDWYYWDPMPIGCHVMNPTNYPDPKGMVEELHKANLHAMISIWPVMGVGTKTFDAMKSIGGITNITWDNVVTHTWDHYYDAHSPKARDLYWRQSRDSLIARYNWDAWWIDQCEPDNGTLLDERRKCDFEIGKGIDYFNTYSLMHTTGIYGGWRKDIQNKRAFFLSRQAFAGQQRNAATLWSSDITCTFKAFKCQVPQGINACASGYPYWTSDIGGYHYGWQAPNWATPANRELFTRWFQFGTFCPIFRIHGKGERALFSNNWTDEMKKTLLHYDNLRYRLMPYLYSLAWKTTSENYTMMRALAFDFSGDAAINNIPDQYMFGPAFLVNPVTAQGKTSRSVYLPKASKWYDFWTGKTYEGGQTIEAAAPIETMPLYVRSGSIVPMGPYLQYATEKLAETIELRIYTGADGEFTLYEDENDTYNYEYGKYATFTFNWNDKEGKLTISDRKGEFPGMLQRRSINIVLVKENYGSNVEIVEKATKTVEYTGSKLEVKVQ